jgi:hydrogenase expression/formation protein HypC
MCLSVPGKIVEIHDNNAKVEIGGVLRDISIDVCPDVVIGEYVLIHAGFAIQRLDEKEAKETLDLLRRIAESL